MERKKIFFWTKTCLEQVFDHISHVQVNTSGNKRFLSLSWFNVKHGLACVFIAHSLLFFFSCIFKRVELIKSKLAGCLAVSHSRFFSLSLSSLLLSSANRLWSSSSSVHVRIDKTENFHSLTFLFKHPFAGHPVILTLFISLCLLWSSNGRFSKFDLIQSLGFRFIQVQLICHHHQQRQQWSVLLLIPFAIHQFIIGRTRFFLTNLPRHRLQQMMMTK